MRNPMRIIWVFIAMTVILAGALAGGFTLAKYGGSLGDTYDWFALVLMVLGLVLLLIVLVVEFVSPFIVPSATWNTALVALGILLTFFFTRDGLLLFGVGGGNLASNEAAQIAWDMLRHAFYLFSNVFILRFFSHDLRQHINRRFALLGAALLVVDCALYAVLYWVGLEWIAVAIWMFISFFAAFAVSLGLDRSGQWSVITGLTMLIHFVLSLACLSDAASRNHPEIFTSHGITGVLAVLTPLCFGAIYLFFTIGTGKSLAEKERFEKRLQEMQTHILKNQISSHFLFNTLGVIKASYRVDTEKGDLAIDLLSKFFRSYTEAGDTYLVPLKKELNLLSSYLELQNLKGGKPFTILFNIEEYGYSVPYFSLQPLLENAIQYSGVNEKEDGWIQIDSHKEGDEFVLAFSDNGVGFDAKSVRAESVGLRNVESRFKILLNATMSIESAVGEGTRIVFRIPISKEEQGGRA